MSYQYVYTPFAHQAEGIQLVRGRTTYGFFDEPGCGKSKVIVDGANLLFIDHAICAVLVVCPNTVKATWANPEWGQIATHSPQGFPYEIVRLDSGKRWPVASSFIRSKGERLFWLITNYEALRSGNNERWLCDFLANTAPSMMVLDESTKVKNRAALQTKAALRVGNFATRRYILTGTPIAKNPLDLFSQFEFLDPRILGYRSFVAFRNRYAIMGGFMVGGRPVQTVGWQNLDELKQKIAGHSRVVEKRSALPDLPDKLFTRIEIPLSEEQERAYKQMRDNAVATVPGTIGQATASIALTKMLRLQQITSGHLSIKHSVTGVESLVEFEKNPKYDFVMDLLEQVDHLVIFGQFIPELEGMAQRLKKAGVSYGIIYGATKNKEREAIQDRYKRGELQVVLCQIVTGGIGLTLVTGSTAVYLSNHFSYEVRIQSQDRLHRPGQQHNVQYYDLIATCDGEKTVDHTVMKAVEAKENLSDFVLGRSIEEVV